ncbi:MAG: hypothetical protein AAF892_01110 [Cyanobacteria bacterium P01_D01_bin.71]
MVARWDSFGLVSCAVARRGCFRIWLHRSANSLTMMNLGSASTVLWNWSNSIKATRLSVICSVENANKFFDSLKEALPSMAGSGTPEDAIVIAYALVAIFSEGGLLDVSARQLQNVPINAYRKAVHKDNSLGS